MNYTKRTAEEAVATVLVQRGWKFKAAATKARKIVAAVPYAAPRKRRPDSR